MVKFLAKKWFKNQMNTILEKYKDDVVKASEQIKIWIVRLQSVVDCLKKVNSRVADGKIEDSEIDDTMEDIDKIVKEW